MSLFKARECWLTQCGIDECFDNKTLLVTTLNTEYDLIIIGSHSGILRIYQPSLLKTDKGHIDGYKPTDLLIEKQLPHPILQMSKGRLVSGNQFFHLALLHPRSLGVYSLVRKSGSTEHGNHNNVILVYEHALKRSTSDVVIGPFGNSQTRDFTCVQSLDGMLTFFEQENFAFCCFLPHFLLPGPIIYVKTIDSFITCGSNWHIQCYSYRRLSEIGQNSKPSDTEGEYFDSDWSYNVGENVFQLEVVKITVTEYCIVALGEKNLFCLTENGNLIFMKRFDFIPLCCHSYFMGSINKLMILVMSETDTLLIYENASLRWSARLSLSPVALSRGSFVGIKGVLVFLSEEGAVQICYLGTEPILFTAPPLVNKELDFHEAEEELATLNKIIKANRSNDIALSNSTSERELIVTVTVDPHLRPCQFIHDPPPNQEHVQMCIISVELLPNAPFVEAQICFETQHPIKIEPNVHFVSNLEDKEKVLSYAYQKESKEVSSLEVKVIVSHITRLGVPRVIVKTVHLPLKLVMVTGQQAKESAHKITFNIDQALPPLSTIFQEYAGEQSLTLTTNTVTFSNILGAGSPVTVLAAKSSSKYRLQSDSLASINLLTYELNRRLTKHFESSEDFKIKHSSSVPTKVFLDIVEKHFNKRQKLVKIQNDLNDLATQYRLIQKRLIAKFKDRNPTALNNLDKLLLETHKEIIDTSERLVKVSDDLLTVQCELSCVVQLFVLLFKYTDIPEDILKKINSVFVTPINDLENQGWEDIIDACMNQLLRTVLAKSDKDKLKSGPSTLDNITDLSRFKKHVTQVFDRLSKDTALLESQDSEEQENTEDVEDEEVKEQLGSKLAEYNVRAKSAKSSSTKKFVHIEEEYDDILEKLDDIIDD